MKRPDAEIVRRALTGGKRVLGDTTNLHKLIEMSMNEPLISMTENLFDQTPIGKFAQNLEKNGYTQEAPEPVFNEWAMQLRHSGKMTSQNGIINYTSRVWGCFLDVARPDLTCLKDYPRDLFDGQASWNGFDAAEVMDEHRGKYLVMLCAYEGDPFIFVWQGWAFLNPDGNDRYRTKVISAHEALEYWGEKITGLEQHAAHLHETSLATWAYAKYGDKHLVEVAPVNSQAGPKKKSPLNKGKPWRAASGPNILLLDRMPATQKPGCGTHASPKPHRRRGHWKTLSHPRYRHHPQYQKKIYVKPSFVGPKQATYEGNIYRLVQPLEEAINV